MRRKAASKGGGSANLIAGYCRPDMGPWNRKIFFQVQVDRRVMCVKRPSVRTEAMLRRLLRRGEAAVRRCPLNTTRHSEDPIWLSFSLLLLLPYSASGPVVPTTLRIASRYTRASAPPLLRQRNRLPNTGREDCDDISPLKLEIAEDGSIEPY